MNSRITAGVVSEVKTSVLVVEASAVPLNNTPEAASEKLMTLSLAMGRVNTGTLGAMVSITTLSALEAAMLPAASMDLTLKSMAP